MSRRLDQVRQALFAPELDPIIDLLWPDPDDLPAPHERIWLPPELQVFGEGVEDGVISLHVATPELKGALPGIVVTYPRGEPEFVGPLAKGLRAVEKQGFGADADLRRRAGEAAALAEQMTSTGTPGYAHVQASDGLVVRFPANTWLRLDTSQWTRPRDSPARMEKLIAAGRIGSALAIGRTGLFGAVGERDNSLIQAVLGNLEIVYRALNREVLADIARDRVAWMQQQA